MFRTITVTVAVAAMTIAPAMHSGADAATKHGHLSQANARKIGKIPHDATYVQGSAVKITKGLRCFTARPERDLTIQGVRVSRYEYVGYCSDGYVDAYTDLGTRIIHPAR